MGSKKLLPHMSALEGPSSMSPYKQIIVVNSVAKFTDKQHSVCAHTLCSNHGIVTHKYNGTGSLESSVLAVKTTLQNARSSRHMVKSSHSQLVTTPLYMTVNSSHDFRQFRV